MRIYTYRHRRTFTRAHKHVHAHTHIYTHTHTHTYIHICRHTQHAHTLTRTQTHVHAHTHPYQSSAPTYVQKSLNSAMASQLVRAVTSPSGDLKHEMANFIIEACHMPGTVVGCHSHSLGFCLARGCATTLCTQTYHQLLQHFGTSITNAYSIHFVKSSGLNAKAKLLK